jgi:type IV secretory pathway ATPase VirB11/archaellum biosynthesis ATPase
MDDLVRTAMRMRPRRICVGEVLGGEMGSMLLALNSGTPGMTTLHANSSAEVFDKLALRALGPLDEPRGDTAALYRELRTSGRRKGEATATASAPSGDEVGPGTTAVEPTEAA